VAKKGAAPTRHRVCVVGCREHSGLILGPFAARIQGSCIAPAQEHR
jgi:hypothetical protein